MYIYIYIYVYIYIYILCVLYISHIYIYTYQQGFPYWEIGVIPPLTKNLLIHPAPGTIFPHQRLIPSPLNKNFNVINQ